MSEDKINVVEGKEAGKDAMTRLLDAETRIVAVMGFESHGWDVTNTKGFILKSKDGYWRYDAVARCDKDSYEPWGGPVHEQPCVAPTHKEPFQSLEDLIEGTNVHRGSYCWSEGVLEGL